ncbi:hypothetical protein KJ969_03160 [Patescibacteria group bacterium]|nr:hypothetical protein [Patescibacteria group bacterium]MBU1922321.1 hypothetical protein [Patescibacteria group bacterium]
MLILTHALTGAVIGQVVRHSALAFIFGWVMHFVMDMIPHGDSKDYAQYKKTGVIPKWQIYQMIFDNVIMFGLMIYLLIFNVESYWWPTFWGILGSILPDIIVAIHECRPSKITRPFHKLHFYFHDLIPDRWRDIRFRYAVIIQIVLIVIMLKFL